VAEPARGSAEACCPPKVFCLVCPIVELGIGCGCRRAEVRAGGANDRQASSEVQVPTLTRDTSASLGRTESILVSALLYGSV
jgi:hypothetical protein